MTPEIKEKPRSLRKVEPEKLEIKEFTGSPEDNINSQIVDQKEDVIDENLTTLHKVHAILLNCINLTKKQKLDFAESERFFMKLYLKTVRDKLRDL